MFPPLPPHSRCVDPASLHPPHPPHPALHPSIRLPSVDISSSPEPTFPISRRKRSATGTRRHITVESLIPIDAPIQPRNYLTPSTTSRKDAFPGYRQRQSRGGDDDEEDELVEEPLCSLSEQQQIEWKRRQNTLAARKSRQRKLMHQLELETTVKHLTAEKETWKARAQMYEALLRSNGINVPEMT